MTYTRRGRWALVTGASAGIGKEFAKQLAAGGTNLLLTARRMDRLEALAPELRSASGIKIECVAADLEDTDGPAKIFAFAQDKSLKIDILINNAGFGDYGAFANSDLRKQLGMVKVNCGAVVNLTHLFLPGMIERRAGEILILASTAAFQPVPYMSVYAATKAFDMLFAEGLAQEVKRFGIRVCALCPGSTESEFHDVAGSPGNLLAMQETAEQVVRVGLKALASVKHVIVSGWKNCMGAGIQRLVPRRIVSHMTEKLFRPKK